jgi:hypothetical protein
MEDKSYSSCQYDEWSLRLQMTEKHPEHIQKTDQVHGQYAIDLGQITCSIANRPWLEDSPGPGPYVQTILGPKKWVVPTYLKSLQLVVTLIPLCYY